MPRVKPSGVKSSLTIAVAVHVVLFFIVFVWAARTGRLPGVLREIVAVIIPPEKKEEAPKPPPEKPLEKPAEQPADQPPPDPNTPPAVAAPLTAVAVDPNAVPTANPGSFAAEVRKPGQPAAPLIQPAVTGPVTSGPRPETRRPTPTTALETTKPSTVARVLEQRQKAVAVSDAIGSEQISKSGTSDAGEVVAKVTGTTVVEGRHVVVRGLSDRYTATTLNGADIPSADPYRKSVQLDLIPAPLIDSIVVNKTLTPDQPGGFTGGAIDIITKSFPEKRTFSFSTGVSYNEQSNLQKDFLTYGGGSDDWLAKDDGTREIPGELADANLELPKPAVFLPRRDEPKTDVEFREAEVAREIKLLRSFRSSEFAGTKAKSPLNHGYSIAAGDTVLFNGRPLGFAGGVSYNRDYSFLNDSIRSRYNSLKEQTALAIENRATEQTSWSTFLNVAYKLFPAHQLGANIIFNQNAEDMARHQVGTNELNSVSTAGRQLIRDTLHYTERSLQTYQINGKHDFPEVLNSRLEWLGSFTTTGQNEPDLRYFNYYRTPDITGTNFVHDIANPGLPQPINPSRFYRELEEQNANWKIDHITPFSIAGGEHQFKMGVAKSMSEREFQEKTFTYLGDSGFKTGLSPNQYLDPEYLGFTTRTNSRGQVSYDFDDNNRFLASETGNNFYRGNQEIEAGYLMTELELHPKLRLVGGARYETTLLSILGNITTNGVKTNLYSETTEQDLLPSAGLIYQVRSNINLRLNFGKSLARPAYREIAPYRSYDPVEDELLEGNPTLALSRIDNYDLRLEWFPRPGEVYSASLFYKNLDSPIEKYLQSTDGGIITYTNRESAIIYGIELEVRKSLDFIDPLLRDFSLGLNAALIASEVDLTPTELFNKRSADPEAEESRPLYDQSPYVFNIDLNYSNPRIGSSVTLLMNMTGPRIYIATGKGPDIYEEPGAQLDFIFSQRLTRNWKMRLSAKNLLDPQFERNYGKDRGLLYSSYRKGRTFGLSLNYTY